MELEHVRVGQRVRVQVPGIGDDGQVGTIKKVRGGRCYVRLDWDARPWHVIMFYPADLELLPNAPRPPTRWGAQRRRTGADEAEHFSS